MKKTLIAIILLCIVWSSAQSQTDKLHVLLKGGKATMAEIIEAVNNGADVNAAYTDIKGWAYGLRPVHLAAAYANLEQLQYLYSKGADVLQKVDIEFPEWWAERHIDCTPLHVAVFYYNVEKTPAVLDFLVSKGADVNELCYGGQTPLMYALMGNYTGVEALKYLVSKGAKVNKLRNDAAEKEDGVLYYCLTNEGKDRSEEAEYLMQQGAKNIMCDNFDNWELLNSCIYFNDNKIGQLLLKYKLVDLNRTAYMGLPTADDNRRNVNNFLHFAVLCGNYQMAQALLNSGVSPDSKIEDGATAYDCAREKNDDLMLNLLQTGRLPQSFTDWIALKDSKDYGNVNFAVQNRVEPFAIETTDGLRITQESFEGKVVLLNFWATWCGYCIQEMPEMDELAKHFGSSKFKVLAVSVDSKGEEAKMRAFVADHNYSFVYAYDPGKEIFDLYPASIPGTYLLDKHGKIVARVDGAISWADDKYKKLIQTLIDMD